ncbi:MAG: hypothetical protein ABI972_15645 [Acidobacteriota bacterium]
MEEPAERLTSEVCSLRQAVTELQRRVSALEGAGVAETAAQPGSGAPQSPVRLPGGQLAAVRSEQVIPLFGWAFLGLAGAYLLRASNAAGLLPGVSGAFVGIAYAGLWLLLASRASTDKPLFSAVHGLTAALILAPLLWETTVRLDLLGPAASSAIVSAFAVLGLAIAWKRNLTSIAWIVTIAGLLTSTALFRERHDAAAWLASVLFIAMAVELSACRDHWLSLRWMTAGAADLTVLISTMFVTMWTIPPPWAPSARLVLGAQIVLLTIYLASTVDRTILRGLSITGFETGQAALAFAVSIGGAFYLARSVNTSSLIIGLFCLLGGAACYAVSFTFLEHRPHQGRNFHTYSTFAILLISAGIFTVLPGAFRAAGWSILATLMMIIGILWNRTTLRVHAVVYLLLSVLSADLFVQAWARLIRESPLASQPIPAAYAWALAGVAVVYGLILRVKRRREPHWTDTIESAATAALLLLGGLAMLSEWVSLLPFDTAPLRTAVLAGAALSLAEAGTRWQRAELGWLVFPVLALTGYKILVEEFQQGRSLSLVASLILFGGTLILLPRLRRQPDRGDRAAVSL